MPAYLRWHLRMTVVLVQLNQSAGPPTTRHRRRKRAPPNRRGIVWGTDNSSPPAQVIGWENIELISDRPLEVMLDEFARLKKEFPGRILIASIMEEYNRVRSATGFSFVTGRGCRSGLRHLIQCRDTGFRGRMGLSPACPGIVVQLHQDDQTLRAER